MGTHLLTTPEAMKDFHRLQEEFEKASQVAEIIGVVSRVLSMMDDDVREQVVHSLKTEDSIATLKEKIAPFVTQWVQRRLDQLDQQLEDERRGVREKIQCIVEEVRSEKLQGIEVERAVGKARAMMASVGLHNPTLERLWENLPEHWETTRKEFLRIANVILDDS